ncbi:hypothetical protein AWZ03_000030 [Drosophila navojoa]|uniref:Uncharacterized protein n=1 Tax=Drosophila navojoa TaxID=7232 RepID=A0A484C0F5_DRONA|nr:hypothetical protein AWZ03_000030 [Drosophila navojoa]
MCAEAAKLQLGGEHDEWPQQQQQQQQQQRLIKAKRSFAGSSPGKGNNYIKCLLRSSQLRSSGYNRHNLNICQIGQLTG